MENLRDRRMKFPCEDNEGVALCCLDFTGAKQLVGKIFGGVSRCKSHSCDNLLVLWTYRSYTSTSGWFLQNKMLEWNKQAHSTYMTRGRCDMPLR